MSRPRVLVAAASAGISLLGCGVELGALAGAQLREPHLVSSNHLAVSTKIGSPLNQEGWLVGAEVGARSEQDVGSRWLLGARVGYGSSPDPAGRSLGWEAHVDVGTPFGHGGLARDWSFYAGGGAAAVFWLSDKHEAADLNASQWVLERVVELVPYASARVHWDAPGETPAQTRYDVGLGAALRLRFVSDLF